MCEAVARENSDTVVLCWFSFSKNITNNYMDTVVCIKTIITIVLKVEDEWAIRTKSSANGVARLSIYYNNGCIWATSSTKRNHELDAIAMHLFVNVFREKKLNNQS
jgi:hypothetical protein